MLWHTDALLDTNDSTHRSFYTQKLLHTDAFAHRRFYNAFTQRNAYAQKPLHWETFTQRSFVQTVAFTLKFKKDPYTEKSEKPFHRGAFTRKSYRTENLLHTDAFMHTNCNTTKFLLTDAFSRKRFYTEFYTQMLLHADASTQSHPARARGHQAPDLAPIQTPVSLRTDHVCNVRSSDALVCIFPISHLQPKTPPINHRAAKAKSCPHLR